MKPDKKLCLYCGKEIEGKKTYCDDAHRMAYKRQSEQQPEQITNPNTNKPEHLDPEQPNPNKDQFRSSLTKTDKTFYDRAMKDFGEPYYHFDAKERTEKCLECGAAFKTNMTLLRFCSYDHYSKSLVASK